MPNSSASYFQGTLQTNGGAGTVFGDGPALRGRLAVAPRGDVEHRRGVGVSGRGSAERVRARRDHEPAANADVLGLVSQRGELLRARDVQSDERVVRVAFLDRIEFEPFF